MLIKKFLLSIKSKTMNEIYHRSHQQWSLHTRCSEVLKSSSKFWIEDFLPIKLKKQCFSISKWSEWIFNYVTWLTLEANLSTALRKCLVSINIRAISMACHWKCISIEKIKTERTHVVRISEAYAIELLIHGLLKWIKKN